jgi:hypothetical protein
MSEQESRFVTYRTTVRLAYVAEAISPIGGVEVTGIGESVEEAMRNLRAQIAQQALGAGLTIGGSTGDIPVDPFEEFEPGSPR